MIKKDTIIKINARKKLVELALKQYYKKYEHGKNGLDSFYYACLACYLYNEVCNINLYKDGFGLSTTTKIMTSSYGIIRIFSEKELNKDLSLIRSKDIISDDKVLKKRL